MATLEVHDEQGRVSFVELTRDHPLLFGTSSSCDIVLDGQSIEPVHGRIRWKKKRYKVEASPSAEFVTVNGHKMTSASLHQGDELVVGACRIFMFRADDDLKEGGERPLRMPDEERTRVLEGPRPKVPSAASSPRRERRKRARGRTSSAGSLLERDEWLEELGLGADKADAAPQLPEGGGRRSSNEVQPGRLRRWLQALRAERAEAPGQERIISSPLVLTLLAAIAILVLLGFGLRAVIARHAADQQFNNAMTALEDGDYRNAIRDFDGFLESNPDDPRVGKARVRRAMANVRQYVTLSGGTWTTAFDAAREMFEAHSQDEEFRDDRVELADLVIRIGEGLADRARRSADAKALEEAESAVPLHAQIAGEPAPAFLNRSRLPGLIDQARAAVRKATERLAALDQMTKAIESGSASGVYKARDSLVDRYADLANDPELVKRMTMANDLIRQGVTVSRVRRAAATTERAAILGPTTSFVLRSSSVAPKNAPSAEATAYALADGLIYALDAATGAPLWQRFVGLSSPYVPAPISGTQTVLAIDAGSDELLRLDARNGRLLWRVDLGEPVESAPLVLGEQLFQVLPSGKLLVIELESGDVTATVNLGLALTRSPVSDEQGRYLYLVGRRDCLFVLARETLSCAAVEYLGHAEGSIPCSPARLGRFLVVAENDRPADSRWRVLVLDEEGSKLRPVQQVDVPGWTWSTPAAMGSIIWATGDKGGIEAYAVGDYASKIPLRLLAKLDPDISATGPVYGLAVSERELWRSSTHSGKFDLDPERGSLTARSALPRSGPALSPLRLAGGKVIMSHQDPATGGVSLTGLDSASGTVGWQTVLGAPWPSTPEPANDGQAIRLLGRNGQELTISLSSLEQGGFVTMLLPGPGEEVIPEGTVLRSGTGADSVTVLAPEAGTGRVWVRTPDNPTRLRPLDLPAALAAPPLLWGKGLFVAGADGRAYLVDPRTARSIAEPFLPVFNRDRQGRWRAPFAIGPETIVLADDVGRVRLLSLQEKPVSRLLVRSEKLLDKPIIADPINTEGAVLVVTADQQVRALSTRDLGPVGSWPLEAPLAAAPMEVGGRGFVLDEGGGIMAFGRNGQRTWSIRLDAPAVGPPALTNDLIWILDREGRLHGRSLADGSPRQKLTLGIVPAGGIVAMNGRALIPIARGSLRSLPLGGTPAQAPAP